MKKMMRILGNSFAKFGRMGGRLRSRNFSSAAVKDDAPGYLARAVAGGIGYMIGGWISEPVTKQAETAEEIYLGIKRRLDESERELEARMK